MLTRCVLILIAAGHGPFSPAGSGGISLSCGIVMVHDDDAVTRPCCRLDRIPPCVVESGDLQCCLSSTWCERFIHLSGFTPHPEPGYSDRAQVVAKPVSVPCQDPAWWPAGIESAAARRYSHRAGRVCPPPLSLRVRPSPCTAAPSILLLQRAPAHPTRQRRAHRSIMVQETLERAQTLGCSSC